MKIKLIEGGRLPEYKTEGSSGADCYARLDDDVIINPNDTVKIPLGFALEIPKGYEVQIRPRSGISLKGIIGFLGTIDSDYRGEVSAIIHNSSDTPYTVHNQDRLVQMVVCPVIKAEFHIVNNLSDTDRGNRGFGSTGMTDVYVPFTTFNQVEDLVGCPVIIDDVYDAMIYSVFYDNRNVVKIEFKLLKCKINNCTNIDMELDEAFERVTIRNHKFGAEVYHEQHC